MNTITLYTDAFCKLVTFNNRTITWISTSEVSISGCDCGTSYFQLEYWILLTISWDRMVLSLWGSFSSRAMTTQLAMMVMIMIHSNTGQLTNQMASLRMGLRGPNKNSELGPSLAPFPLLLSLLEVFGSVVLLLGAFLMVTKATQAEHTSKTAVLEPLLLLQVAVAMIVSYYSDSQMSDMILLFDLRLIEGEILTRKFEIWTERHQRIKVWALEYMNKSCMDKAKPGTKRIQSIINT